MKIRSRLAYLSQWLIVQWHRLQSDGVRARAIALVRKLLRLNAIFKLRARPKPANLSAREQQCYQEVLNILSSKKSKSANRH